MPTVQFTITDQEKAFFVEYARRKGLTLSALAKMSIFTYEASHRFNDWNLAERRNNGPTTNPA